MTGLTFYYDLMSQPCRTTFIFLSVNKIPFEAKEIQVGLGENRTPEYKKINRLQQVPVVSDGDFYLTESIAIVRYLTSKRYDIADHWYPKDIKQRARVDEYLEYQHLGLRIHCARYFRVKYLYPLLNEKEPNPDKIVLLKKNMSRACDIFQEHWLGNKPFICGDTITVADIFAATELEQPTLAGYDPREGRPLLAAWMERVRRKTNPHYDIAHATLYRLIKENLDNHPALKAKH